MALGIKKCNGYLVVFLRIGNSQGLTYTHMDRTETLNLRIQFLEQIIKNIYKLHVILFFIYKIILWIIENRVTCMLVGRTLCGEFPCNSAVEDD